MPSGPKKRHAARRRSMGGRPGTRTSLGKTSVSNSHASDDGTSPKTSDHVNSLLSLSTGTNERPADQTFQTEEWVRVSDFDVGTPTSTTTKSDLDARDSFGDVQGHDKLVDWETVSRENTGNSSSAEEVGEGDHLAAEDSSGSVREQGQKLPHDEVLLSDSDSLISEKEDDDKSLSSKRVGEKIYCGRTCTSSRNACYRPDAHPQKAVDEERSGSIVVVQLHREHEGDSQGSCYPEFASVEAREEDYHGSIADVFSSEGKDVDCQAISAIESASSEEQDEDNFESFSGVDYLVSCAIEPASSEEQEEGKYRLFTDVSNLKGLLGQEESSGDSITLPSRFECFSSFVSSCINESATSEVEEAGVEEPKTIEKGHRTPGRMKTQDIQEPGLKEMKPETPEVNTSTQEVTDCATFEPFPHNLPENHPLKRNIQEESFLAQEEQELGKGILEPQSLMEALSATDHSKPLERGGMKDLQSLVAEEAPLLKDSPSPVDKDLYITVKLKDRVPELFTKESGGELQEESQDGVVHEHQTAEFSLMDDSALAYLSLPTILPLEGESAGKELSLEEIAESYSLIAVDHPHTVESEPLRTEIVKRAVAPLVSSTDSEWLKGSAESTKDVEPTSEVDNIDRNEKVAGSSEKLEQVTYQRREEQPRIIGPIQASSDTWGCCEPVQWLFAYLTQWVDPRAVQI